MACHVLSRTAAYTEVTTDKVKRRLDFNLHINRPGEEGRVGAKIGVRIIYSGNLTVDDVQLFRLGTGRFVPFAKHNKSWKEHLSLMQLIVDLLRG